MIERTFRVVVTGIGVLSPNGIGKDAFWQAVLTGVSGVRRVTLIDVSDLPCKIGGEIVGFDPLDYLDFKVVKRTGRSVHLAMAAAKLALKDAGIEKEDLDTEDTGLFMGLSCPSMDTIGSTYEDFLTGGPNSIHPYALFSSAIHLPTKTICNELGLRSSSITVSTNCTAGLNAIGYAFQMMRDGKAKTMITGGFDAPITRLLFAAFCKSGLLTSYEGDPGKASRPFDRTRDGGILSEGAAIVILEELGHALRHGRRVYGEVTGFGNAGEFVSEMQLNGKEPHEGMSRAIRMALYDAGIAPEQIDYFSAHAPSDQEIDKMETDAVKEVFGKHAYRMPISSIKSTTGNPVAGAAPMQVATGLLAMQEQRIPPTVNYEYPDPDCDLDYVPNKMRYNNVGNVLVNSHGFGGNCSALVLRKFES